MVDGLKNLSPGDLILRTNKINAAVLNNRDGNKARTDLHTKTEWRSSKDNAKLSPYEVSVGTKGVDTDPPLSKVSESKSPKRPQQLLRVAQWNSWGLNNLIK